MTVFRSICIVDDSADYRLLLKRLFQRSYPAYSIRLFDNGQALLSELPHIREEIAFVLLDRHMPFLDGHQTLIRLKQEPAYQTIPVVMMSAEASYDEIQNCYRSGANSFILKTDANFNTSDALSLIGQYWLKLNQIAH